MLKYGNKEIKYSIFRSERKTIEISVNPDLSVIVKAPTQVSDLILLNRLNNRVAWISKQIDAFSKHNPMATQRQFVSGEAHYYLGRQYKLKVIKSDEATVKFVRGMAYVCCRDIDDRNLVETLLAKWYLQKAQKVFDEAIERCLLQNKFKNISKPKLQIRKMKKRWGSMSKKGTLILNTNLVKAPKECIDYVVTHEICHLIHHNHSKEYYSLLRRVMPDWESRKCKLES